MGGVRPPAWMHANDELCAAPFAGIVATTVRRPLSSNWRATIGLLTSQL
jgi:hypothetical protein